MYVRWRNLPLYGILFKKTWHMPKNCYPQKDTGTAKNAGRVTKSFCSRFIGKKAYLYRSGIESYYGEDKTTFYSEAAKEFADIIDRKYGAYDLTNNYADNFDVAHENNEESILEFQFWAMWTMRDSIQDLPLPVLHSIHVV